MTTLTTIVKQFLTSQEQVTKALDEAVASGNLHIDEIAQVNGCSERQAYRYTEGEVSLKAHQLITLALIENSRGGNKLLSLIIPEGSTIVVTHTPEVNGSIEDEVIDSVRSIAGAEENFNNGNFEAVEHHAKNLRTTADRMTKEAKKAKGKGKR